MATTTLYHYCSIEAFVSIISNRTIRLSLLNQSNDTEEGRWILRFLKQRIDQDKELLPIKDRLLGLIEGTVQFLSFGGFCLSEHGDLLSQWRGYADNGRGVAIGFSSSYLEKLGALASAEGSGISLGAVTYGDPDQDSDLVKLLTEILQRAKILSKCNRGSLLFPAPEEDKKDYEKANNSLIFATAPLMLMGHKYKNPAFGEEREWRLTSVISPVENGGLSLEELCEFRSVGDRLVPYRPVQLLDAGQKAIDTVVLGPRNVSLGEHVSAMLRKHGFRDVEIKRSSATYR